MLLRITLALLFLLPYFCFAQQGRITGNVTDSKSGKPVANASVFLSNATKGSETDASGNFELTSIKQGEYDLVVSLVGYNTFSKRISVNGSKLSETITLEEKITELQEVVVRPDKNWAGNYDQFKLNFIGRGANAALTKITNPQAVRLYYDIPNNKLEASSDEFLIIENKALGYRLKYLLSGFSKDYNAGLQYYEGQVLFEELPGSKSQLKKWKENRLHTYLGSDMHLYRSLISNQLTNSGFILHKLIRKDNPERPSDSLIQSKKNQFMPGGIMSQINSDSLQYWIAQSKLPKTIQTLITDTLQIKDVLAKTDKEGLYALRFNDNLYVVYSKKQDQSVVHRAVTTSEPSVTVITLKEPYALFDSNGVMLNPQSVLYEGFWGDGVANMLPNDYEP